MHVYKSSHSRVPAFKRCLIVKTDTYNREQIAKVLQVRANVEGLKLGPGVLDRLSAEGEKASLRYVIVPILNHPSPQSLPPRFIFSRHRFLLTNLSFIYPFVSTLSLPFVISRVK